MSGAICLPSVFPAASCSLQKHAPLFRISFSQNKFPFCDNAAGTACVVTKDRRGTPALRSRPLRPYVPLRSGPSGSASAVIMQTVPAEFLTTRSSGFTWPFRRLHPAPVLLYTVLRRLPEMPPHLRCLLSHRIYPAGSVPQRPLLLYRRALLSSLY